MRNLADLRWRRILPWLCGAVAAVMALRSLARGDGLHASDFSIYLEAAHELARGGFDLYRPRSSPPYPYPHVFLLPICALQALLSDRLIIVLWALGLGLATRMLIADLWRAMQPFGGLSGWQWLVFALLFQRCIAQNLTHGQLGLWVAALLLRGTVLLADGRDRGAGFWLGIAAALKLTPIAYVVALPCMRRWQAALALLLTVLAAVVLLPWPFLGAEHWRHLHDFHRAMLAPLFDRSLHFAVQDHQGPSIAGTLDYLLQRRPFGDDQRVIAIVDLGDGQLRLVKLLWSAVVASLCGLGFWRAGRFATAQRLLVQSGITMLAIAFFAPHTNVYHLAGALLPAALFCQGPGRRDRLWWCAAAGLLLSMTLRQKNLIGATLWRGFADYGLLHVSLVLMLLWLTRWIWRAGGEWPAGATSPVGNRAP